MVLDFRFFTLIAILQTEMVFFYNSFLFFSYSQTDELMSIDYIPWMAGIILILVINKLLLRKSRTIVSIAVVNSLITAVWLFIEIKFFFHLHGFGPYGYACGFIIISASRAAYLAYSGIKESNVIMHTEFSIMSAAFFFMTQIGPFKLTQEYNYPSILMVAINILALIRSRIYDINTKNKSVSKWQGTFFIIAITGFILSLASGVLIFLSSSFRSILIKIITELKYVLLLMLYTIGELVKKFFMLFKFEGEPMLLPDNSISMSGNREADVLNFNITAWIPWILIIIAAFALILIIYKFRKAAISKVTVKSRSVQQRQIIRFSIWNKIKDWLYRIIFKIKLRFLEYYFRNTVGGVYIILERSAKRMGYPKDVSETPGAYLRRLMKSEMWDYSEISDGYTLIGRLISELEYKLYFGHDSMEYYADNRLSKTELKKIARLSKNMVKLKNKYKAAAIKI